MLKSHAFISYAVADGSEFVLRLRDDLQKSGVKTWLDKYDIKEGEIFYLAINKGLQSASAIIVILTPASTLSVQVLGEWNFALNSHIPIIPLLVKDTQIPPVLGVLNYIDFRKDYQQGLAQLRQRLSSIENDHRKYLAELLTGLKDAQSKAEFPERFDDKIRSLHTAISHLNNATETSPEESGTSIEVGLEEERQRLLNLSSERSLTTPKRVVGTRLSSAVHFFDRVQAQKDISRLLAEPSTKLVSVISFGGMGKTALASKVLADLEQNRWPHLESSSQTEPIPVDGIVYMSTRTSKISLERIFLDFAELLGGEKEKAINAIWMNSQLETPKKIAKLLEILKEGVYVVLWDNLEDLMDNEGNLQDDDLKSFLDISLVNEHGMRLLVTSRISLASTKTLLPYDNQVPLLEGLPQKEGVEVLRNLDPNGTRGLRDIPYEKAAKVVELVKGVPRALEVVGSILANDIFMSLDDLLTQEQLFQHEKFVEDLVKANYSRQDGDAKYVMEALSVFATPVPLVAIEFLLQPFVQIEDIKNILRRLVQSHNVTIDKESKTISLHPIDRDFIYSQLPIDGDYGRKQLERRAAEYYAQIRTPQEYWTSLEALQPQLSEFDHRIKAQDYNSAAILLDEIDSDYLLYWGHYNRLLTMHGTLLGNITDLSVKGRQLGSIARIPHPILHRNQAFEYAIEALEIAKKVNDRKSVAEWLRLVAQKHLHQRENTLAKQYVLEALQIAEELGDIKLQCQCLLTLAGVQSRLNQITESVESNDRGLSLARANGYKRYEATFLNDGGYLYSSIGQKEKALTYYKEALLLKETQPGMSDPSVQLANIGAILSEFGEFQGAIDYLVRALQFSEGADDKGGLVNRRGHLARAYYLLGDYELSLKHRTLALEMAKSRNHPLGEAIQMLSLAIVQKKLNMNEAATSIFQEALQIASADSVTRKDIYYWKPLILAAFALESYDEVIEASQTSQALFFNRYSFPYHCQAVALLYRNNHDAAKTVFAEALNDANERLAKEPRLQEYKYIRAFSLLSLSILASGSELEASLSEIMEAYRAALEHCAATGVVEEALLLLDRLQPFDPTGKVSSARELLTNNLRD